MSAVSVYAGVIDDMADDRHTALTAEHRSAARRAAARPQPHRARLFTFGALVALSVLKSVAAWGRELDDMPAHHERLACAHSPSCAPHRAGGAK